MTGALDQVHRRRLNEFDILAADGQPVRWAANLLRGRGARLRERVYGPELVKRVCKAAAEEQVGVFLYGSTAEIVDLMRANLVKWYPRLRITGTRPSRFRDATPEEDRCDVRTINDSGAGIVLVGLGCPRQERWVSDHRGKINAVMLCVGAAFDFHAGTLPQAPAWMQRSGLEWFFRLLAEPRRLWKRYIFLNPLFLTLVGLQLFRQFRVRG
jgi:exopolysaccharide biosynthesis WecB/TagA/CpsF family protein